MIIIHPLDTTHSYKLLDSGNQQRLEVFGDHTIIRPDPTCVWKPKDISLWNKATTICSKNKYGGGFAWSELVEDKKTSWIYSYKNQKIQSLSFHLRTSPQSKNIGIFPEQAAHWDWIIKQIKNTTNQASILNLYAYTGGASLVAAAAGAHVCHVDASKTTITWAKQNAQTNGLDNKPIRWIVEDCLVFMKREIQRKKQYTGIIMDPPAFGRDPQGKPTHFEESIQNLLTAAQKLLTTDGFLLLNVYSVPLYATHIAQIVQDFFPSKKIEFGELHLNNGQQAVPCNLFVRVFSSN